MSATDVGLCAADGDVRLAELVDDGNSASGVLEVFSGGAWGRVCRLRANDFRASDFDPPPTFTQQSAAVVCRQLGFTSGTVEADQVPASLQLAVHNANAQNQQVRVFGRGVLIVAASG